MIIYQLKRRDRCGFDEMDGCVVAALSPQEARELAAGMAGDEGPGTWLWRPSSRCQVIGRYTGRRRKPHVIMSETRDG
jgi:hypothetical protein